MAGAYCQFCDNRCFVYRIVPGSSVTHLATCVEGKAYDREQLGVDADTAVNPMLGEHAPAGTARRSPGDVLAGQILLYTGIELDEGVVEKILQAIPADVASTDLREMQSAAWANKVAKGFNTTDVAFEFGLLVGEVGEAFTAWRKGLPDLGEELADIQIFLVSLAQMTSHDLQAEVERKLAINARRVYESGPSGALVRRLFGQDPS